MRIFIVVGLAALLGACASGPANLLGTQAKWCAEQGGLSKDPVLVRRATTAGERLVDRAGEIRVWVLNCESIGAYSYGDGNVYVTRGLLDVANDDEVAAAVAHEMGHLLADGHLAGQAYARAIRRTAWLGKESRADALGVAVLERHHVKTAAMSSMLTQVARATLSSRTRAAVSERIALLTDAAR